MANIASVSYVIEGPKETLQKINEALITALYTKDDKYELYKAAEFLKLPIEINTRLGGELIEEPVLEGNTLRFDSEEKWGLQDFNKLLEKKFPDIKVYWIVEEPGMEIYCTNDAKGKYFSYRYYVDACINANYDSEYFEVEEQVYEWLSRITNGRVKSGEDVERFNADYEDSDASYENWIYIHEFEIEQ